MDESDYEWLFQHLQQQQATVVPVPNATNADMVCLPNQGSQQPQKAPEFTLQAFLTSDMSSKSPNIAHVDIAQQPGTPSPAVSPLDAATNQVPPSTAAAAYFHHQSPDQSTNIANLQQPATQYASPVPSPMANQQLSHISAMYQHHQSPDQSTNTAPSPQQPAMLYSPVPSPMANQQSPQTYAMYQQRQSPDQSTNSQQPAMLYTSPAPSPMASQQSPQIAAKYQQHQSPDQSTTPQQPAMQYASPPSQMSVSNQLSPTAAMYDQHQALSQSNGDGMHLQPHNILSPASSPVPVAAINQQAQLFPQTTAMNVSHQSPSQSNGAAYKHHTSLSSAPNHRPSQKGMPDLTANHMSPGNNVQAHNGKYTSSILIVIVRCKMTFALTLDHHDLKCNMTFDTRLF